MESHAQYRELMRRVFDELREGVRQEVSPREYDDLRESFAYHMTDWADDVQQLLELQERSGSITSDAAAKKVVGLLYHLVPHLTEAGNLLLDGVSDKVSPTKVVQSPTVGT